MKQADHIVRLLGGDRRASEILAVPRNTVRSWQGTGFIPAQRHDDVIEAAARVGIRITPNDFFPGRAIPPARNRRVSAAAG